MMGSCRICGLLAIALTGCAITPDYQPPTLQPTTLEGVQSAALFSTDSPVGDWWATFDDAVLAALVDDALAANLDIRIALARLRQSRAALTEQQLERFPHVTTTGNLTRNHQQQTLNETWTVGFDARWELDLFGGQRRATERAVAMMQATEADLHDVQVSVAAEVARNYFELRGVQQRIALTRSTLDNLQNTQRLTRMRWELGAGSELDVQSSRARLKAIEADIPLLEVAETRYRYRLAVLLGQRPAALGERLAAQTAPAYARPLPLGDVSRLLRQRPDVRATERRLAAATAQVGVATADLFPRISISGFIGFLSGTPQTLLQSAARAWTVAPAMQWAAFDLGSVRARLRASQAQAEQSLAEYERTVLLALEEAQNHLRHATNPHHPCARTGQRRPPRGSLGATALSGRFRRFPDPAGCTTYPFGRRRCSGTNPGTDQCQCRCHLQGVGWSCNGGFGLVIPDKHCRSSHHENTQTW